jgi:hypothetical protein
MLAKIEIPLALKRDIRRKGQHEDRVGCFTIVQMIAWSIHAEGG